MNKDQIHIRHIKDAINKIKLLADDEIKQANSAGKKFGARTAGIAEGLLIAVNILKTKIEINESIDEGEIDEGWA